MKSTGKALKESVGLAGLLLRAQAIPIAAIFLFSLLLNFEVEDALQLMGPARETQRLVTQLGLGIWDLMEGVLVILILSWGIPKIRPPQNQEISERPFAQPYLGSFLAEYLRMLAQIIMWGILLLVPGFVRYWQLIFVPMVALFSKSYSDGKVDALRVSDRMTSGRLQWIGPIITLTMVIEIGLEFLPEMVPGLHGYFIRGGFAALTYFLNVWSFGFFFILFENYIVDAVNEEREA